ncbi:hypothetical protein RRG08_037592 [Elysia crispata]|uniref:Uncharacterized protein n=1 Tax=Elysia crispata TaxID=231223 RepID=A0AAE1DWS2_9GAST|nr:hypothetical protein RRG08_037592 [Elysia crispata]
MIMISINMMNPSIDSEAAASQNVSGLARYSCTQDSIENRVDGTSRAGGEMGYFGSRTDWVGGKESERVCAILEGGEIRREGESSEHRRRKREKEAGGSNEIYERDKRQSKHKSSLANQSADQSWDAVQLQKSID